jgi:pilus assembly protein FimV
MWGLEKYIMSRCLTRISLALVFLLSSEVWAIGLGDINLDSALNEPLRAEIDLLSATPEELSSLRISLASAETFERYGIDRPFYLQELQFNVTTGPGGPIVQVRSRSPITESFLTFLVEAQWSAGRLLREYTVLLDPPTYAPPAMRDTPAVQAPRRATPSDSARIEREPPAPRPEPEPAPEPQPAVTPPTRTEPPATVSEPEPTVSEPEPTVSEPEPTVSEPEPSPTYDEPPSYTQDPGYSTEGGGDVYVNRGDTLWGITQRVRPDSRLTMNQAMLAIYEANRGAFSGNINRLKAGARLRIPSADEVFQISRGDAFAEVKRQNETWRAEKGMPDSSVADTALEDTTYDTGYEDAAPYEDTTGTTDAPYETDYSVEQEPAEPEVEPETETSLTLVPPDEEAPSTDYVEDLEAAEPPTREQEIENRIAELETADVPEQQSLIEIRDNELAALRQELAEIRGEVAAIEDAPAEDQAEPGAGADAGDDVAAEPQPVPTDIVRTPRASKPGIMDRVMAILGSTWLKIIAGAVLLAGVVLWFLRRSRVEDDGQPWETLDSDETTAADRVADTEILRAPGPEASFVVEEQESGAFPVEDGTMEVPAPTAFTGAGSTDRFDSLEDTFSSDTAVNLDQSDPLAEADFHMAYGLYDQAADLINGALESDPGDQALMSKLCEIYFVWGNRDAFVDAATRLKALVGGTESADWDKIVIMGQQIAGDDALFAGADVAGATRAVDLSFESELDEAAELDMEFGDEDFDDSDILDLGADDRVETAAGDIDFSFDDAATEVRPDDEPDTAPTAEMPAPTFEQQISDVGGTAELPSLEDNLGEAIGDTEQGAEATAEINLDELGLDIDVDRFAETELASLDDLEETGTNEILPEDPGDATAKNAAIDPDPTGFGQALNLDDFEDDLGSTGLRLAPDETGRMPTLDSVDEMDLLDATGHTQILSEDLSPETAADFDDLKDDNATLLAEGIDDEEDRQIGADAETLLAPMDDEDDFGFAKTEALPAEVFSSDVPDEETSEEPGVAGTDVDLDLDDLTAALQLSEVGDTIEQVLDDATVEHPGPSEEDGTAEVPTVALGPGDMSDDLLEARTMTEVGTKLDLARAYVDMGDPQGARSILEEVLDEGDEGQRQQAQQLLDSLPG